MEWAISHEVATGWVIGNTSEQLNKDTPYNAIISATVVDLSHYSIHKTKLIYTLPYQQVEELIALYQAKPHITKVYIHLATITVVIQFTNVDPTVSNNPVITSLLTTISCYYGQLSFPPFANSLELINFTQTKLKKWGSLISYTGNSGSGTYVCVPKLNDKFNKIASKRYFEILCEQFKAQRIIVALEDYVWSSLCPEGCVIACLDNEEQVAAQIENVVYKQNGFIVAERKENDKVYRELIFESNPSEVQASITVGSNEDLDEPFQTIIGLIDKDVKSVLVLGGGVGALSRGIRLKYPHIKVTNVEISSDVVDIGKKYFDLVMSDENRFVITDALKYIEQCTDKYDIAVIDINASIPCTNSPPEEYLMNSKLQSMCSKLIVDFVDKFDVPFKSIYGSIERHPISGLYNTVLVMK